MALESLSEGPFCQVVYVDSGSEDSSVHEAKSRGHTVHELDLSEPFTAARARNCGFATLLDIKPDLDFVFFMDGDCKLAPGWIDKALKALEGDPALSIVCGRRREISPSSSIYNALCDREWNSPVGPALACGGDSVMRVSSFQSVGGFNNTVIAGEEPELCYRIRQGNGKIARLDADMTYHDAAISRFAEWAKRSQRSGYAYALGALMHGLGSERFKVRETVRICFWSGLLPFSLLASFTVSEVFSLLLIVYPIQILRIALKEKAAPDIRWSVAFYTVLGQFFEFKGVLKCWVDSFKKRDRTIIEYK